MDMAAARWAGKGELSQHECFLLRTRYDDVHPTEKEKASLTQEAKERMLQKPSEEEIRKSKESDLKVMKMFGLIPEQVTFEEWENAGYPIGWKNEWFYLTSIINTCKFW